MPQALCNMMHERGVRIFSVTDHDTLDAYGQFEVPKGMRLITGIEINTTYRDSEVHVLGYRLPLGASPLVNTLDRNRQARVARIRQIVDQLQACGHAITVADVEAEASEGASLGRPHVAKALIRMGITPDIETAFRSFLRIGMPGYVPSTHISPHEAIMVILASGGIPVLAHPGRLKDYAIIDELAEAGLQGLEVFYPTHETAQVAYFRERAQALDLVMTGGSDFHDIRYHRRGVGIEVEEEDIAPFLELTA